ncbi:MAG: CBS domain-containing protein, partial [Deltaproteobacteria bacterium]|nr:CBS domain-containing protein [Deltaproteobacteria bacterium]
GYDNIERILSGDMLVGAVLLLCTLKFISWAVSLGSGTSGGTLAPLFTIGGGLGLTLGHVFAVMLPAAGIDARIAALVGMAAIFAGASRALLASIVFAFETTFQPYGILPLLGGCTAAFLVSYLAMRNSIMSEKIIRRGVRVLADYTVDFLDQIPVRDYGIRPVVTLRADDSVEDVRTWLASNEAKTGHNGFPVVDDARELIGLVTRRDLMDQRTSDLCLRELPLRPVVVIYDDSSLRDAVDSMARHRIGRLPVVSRNAPRTLIGIITRSDIVEAHMRRRDEHRMEPT